MRMKDSDESVAASTTLQTVDIERVSRPSAVRNPQLSFNIRESNVATSVIIKEENMESNPLTNRFLRGVDENAV